MKKIWIVCIALLLLLSLSACGTSGGDDPADTTAGAPTLLSCVKESSNGLTDTWRLTFSDGTSTTVTAQNGKDGLTPTIGENGNWFIGTVDTGVKAEGTDGAPGAAAAPLTVVSCEEISYVGGVHTYKITFSDGNNATFSVKDGDAGAPGTPGTSPTVVSCTAVSTLNGTTTWRLTFSDGGTADFTVENGKDGESGASFATEEEWLALVERMEAINEAFTVYTPVWTVGNSTVTDHSKTNPVSAHSNLRIKGGAAPVKLGTIFGDADTIYGIVLNSFGIYEANKLPLTKGQIDLEIQFRVADASREASKSTLVASYTVTVDAKGTTNYKLPLTLSKSVFEGVSDDDYVIVGVYAPNADGATCSFSSNTTYKDLATFINGTSGAYANVGYYSVGDGLEATSPLSGAKTNNSYGNYSPDILFVTEQTKSMIDLGSIGSGNGGGTSAPEEEPEEEELGLLRLPRQYDLVVGDTFELYYKGISACLDSDLYAYELAFSDGKSHGANYSRKWRFTPTATDVGVYTMTITVRDNLGKVLDQQSVTINVVGPAASPEEERVVLIVGDSLTDGGVWAGELYRRLTATGGVPAGAGMNNIRFIGTRETAAGVRYEGYGGWTFDSYTTANTARKYFMYIYPAAGASFDPAAIGQHTLYKASNGQLWKIESVEAGRIKIIAVYENGAIQQYGLDLPAAGTLTYYSGGTTAATIAYASSTKAEGNPFWNTEEGKVDFTSYAAAQGVDHIDEVIVLLGWNNTPLSGGALAEKAEGFIDLIHAEFPDCHVTLVGLQVPSRDGFADDYGTSWNYYEKLCKVFEFQDAFIGITESDDYKDSVSFVSLAGQLDAANNYTTTKIPLNGESTTTRDDRTETVQDNGVHPSNAGYCQIADAVYRHLIARWQ